VFGFIPHYVLGRSSQGGDKQDLEAGAEATRETALHFHPHQDSGAVDDSSVLLQ
jgi:hypothetical protein